MSILDGKLFFADDLAVNPSGGVIGDIIDTQTSTLREEFYHGEPVWWVNLITKEAENAHRTSFNMYGGETEDASAWTTRIIKSKGYQTDLVPGAYWNIVMPLSNLAYPRYIGAYIDAEIGDISGMRVTSYLTITPPSFGWEKTKDWRP